MFGTIDDRQRLGGIAGGQRLIAEAADLRHDVFADQRIVLDNQDGFVAAFERGGAGLGGQRLGDARDTAACGRYSFTVVPWPSSL